MTALPALPILEALPALAAALAARPAAVLEAPPGAGKSTVVPLALIDAAWLAGRKIVMLEPRRLAARAVAARLAATLGEPVGRRVGYRMRLDTRVSRETRIEVVTEGILARLLEADPALEDTGLVIFDEFHERSLAGDLGLALCRDVQQNLRPELRLLVMSATLDGAAVARLLGGAPRITSAGRQYPVELRHARRAPEHLEREVANTVRRALAEAEGDVLVFLPGAAEIRRVEQNLAAGELARGTLLLPLLGELAPEAQERALVPDPQGRRKVVLATSIAETSLTIEGVRVVVDSGLARRARFDPGSGMSRLETLPVSLAAAEQRRGRAGRLAPGVCYRVYTEAEERRLPAAPTPEVLEADLAPLALDLAAWGTEAGALGWLDPPPAPHLAQARSLLTALGALDAHGRILPAGRRMARLGLHPRLAHMLLAARGGAATALACRLAALLGERDLARTRPGERDADLGKRLELLAGGAVAGLEADRGALGRVRRLAAQFERDLALAGAERAGGHGAVEVADPGLLLAHAYPDRIARRRGDGGRYLLANGRGAAFAGPDALARQEFLVVAALDAGDREARIQLAAPLALPALLAHFGAAITVSERIEWDRREQAVVARRERRLGALLLEERPLEGARPAAEAQAMLAGVAELGLAALPWTAAATSLRTRVAFLRRVLPPAEAAEWPDWSDAALGATLGEWLAPYLEGITRRDHLARLDLAAILRARLGHAAGQALERLAPAQLTVPSGSRVAIDYGADPPRLAVRLQEIFGLATTPTVAGGRVRLAIELLSPARRPVQLTRDLESFWARGYAEVRKELKGRYPKHYWPDDPRVAEPTSRVRPRR
ncbi:MAG TPA: ATP-dependent helicase HrpB [Steroidobacteraceae bacterium]|nr:ATP-dependent helicase HrpB [Steroidobacteraceae bacterium]